MALPKKKPIKKAQSVKYSVQDRMDNIQKLRQQSEDDIQSHLENLSAYRDNYRDFLYKVSDYLVSRREVDDNKFKDQVHSKIKQRDLIRKRQDMRIYQYMKFLISKEDTKNSNLKESMKFVIEEHDRVYDEINSRIEIKKKILSSNFEPDF